MPEQQPVTLDSTQLLLSQPGVTRDGTRLSRNTYSDALWCRFYQGKPRKIGGYREQARNIDGIVRALDVFSDDGYSYVHGGSGRALNRYTIDNETGIASSAGDRTPAGYVINNENNWQFAQLYNTAGSSTDLFACATPSASSITTNTEMPVYYGDILAATALTAIGGGVTASGGICAIPPYLFTYGHDGIIKWSTPTDPLNFAGTGSGSSRPVANKVVRGLPLRGTQGPAGIWWSLDSVILGQYVDSTVLWTFTTATTSGSILSSNGVIEDNGIYYWPTTSGFSQFNGVVRELPNEDNKRWFFDNLNMAQRQKVFGFKVPSWNELWWCFPYGSATECTHAIIYNKTLNKWYDTVLPNGGRSAAFYDMVFAYPIMTGVEQVSTNKYSAWQHEFGTDEVSGAPATAKAIRSYFATNEFNFVVPPQMGAVGRDQSIAYSIIEPDFEQSGPMSVTMISRPNARTPVSRESISSPITFQDTAATTDDELLKFKYTGRLTRFQFESNVAGGNYVAGSTVVHFKPGDGRRQS